MTNPTTPAPAPTAGQRFAADLAAVVRARTGVIWISTREEGRALRLVFEGLAAAGYAPRVWNCAEGWTDVNGRPISPGQQQDPNAALQTAKNADGRAVFVMLDLVNVLDPFSTRAIRNAARDFPLRPRDQARALILLGTEDKIPPGLAGSVTVLDLPLPDRAEIAALLGDVISAQPEKTREAWAKVAPAVQAAAIDAAVGLTEAEAQGMFQASLVKVGTIDPIKVAQEKKRAISKARLLEWIDPNPAGLAAVGGLENLKAWLLGRAAAFGPRAKAYGLPAPKGALLVGVPGGGKSLVAKCIASAWGMPLLRLDLGALRSKWVGESETNLRSALKLAETVSPCVVWIDEVEKALAGSASGAADGGVGADALGALLSWMQDRAGSVFVIATANDVGSLPPELLRKGRWDELWSVDLPTEEERRAIVKAGLRQYGRAEDIDAAAVARASEGFTGSEIVALIPEALFAAFADGERPIQTADLVAAAGRTVPLSRTAPEKIDAIRKWAKERARPASAALAQETSRGPALDL